MNPNQVTTRATPIPQPAPTRPGLTSRIDDSLEKLYENGPLNGYRHPVPGGWLYVTTLTLGGSATGSVTSTFVAERGR
jgi:hypothetical protein